MWYLCFLDLIIWSLVLTIFDCLRRVINPFPWNTDICIHTHNFKDSKSLLDLVLDHLGFVGPKGRISPCVHISHRVATLLPSILPPEREKPWLPQWLILSFFSLWEILPFTALKCASLHFYQRSFLFLRSCRTANSFSLWQLLLSLTTALVVSSGFCFRFILNLSSSHLTRCSVFLTNLASLPEKGFANTECRLD